jgi:UMF1 family MFS transporter
MTARVTAPKKVIHGWAMFDWANSVYNLVITSTFFPIYFIAATHHFFKSDRLPFMGHSFINSSLYSFSQAGAYLLISLFYPLLTSIADTRGNKAVFMRVFTYMGAAGCSLLYFFDGSNLGLGIFCFTLASVGYLGGLVFYNAYLPEIAAPGDQDRVSAKGYTYGYIGSSVLQLIGFALVLVIRDNPFLGPRLTFLLVGVWWAGFAQVTFAVLPMGDRPVRKGDRPVPMGDHPVEKKKNTLRAGFAEIRKVYNEIKKMVVLKRFLRAFFFYSIGIQTVMRAATLFGSKLLGLEDAQLIITIVLIQLVAVVGAIWFSRLSTRYGNFRVLLGVIVIWVLICLSAYRTAGVAENLKPFHDKIAELQLQKEELLAGKAGLNAAEFDRKDAEIEGELSRWRHDLAPHQESIEYSFYAMALAVGLAMGGILSLSRSTFSKLMPETTDTASYFSYFDLTEKIAIVIGMFSFGLIEQQTGSMKNSLIFLVVFFVIGWVWLYSALTKQNKIKAASSPAG